MTSGRVRGVWGLKGWAAVIGAVGLSVVAAGLAGPAPRAVAKPPGSMEFCKIYPNAHVCAASPVVNCTTCHTVPPARNLFGEQVAANLAPGAARPLSDADYIAALPAALKAVEALDADGDGVSNLAELIAGSQPELSSSQPTSAGCTPGQARTAAAGRGKTCGYGACPAQPKGALAGRGPAAQRGRAQRSRDACAA